MNAKAKYKVELTVTGEETFTAYCNTKQHTLDMVFMIVAAYDTKNARIDADHFEHQFSHRNCKRVTTCNRLKTHHVTVTRI